MQADIEITTLVVPVRRVHLDGGTPRHSTACAVALAVRDWFHGLVQPVVGAYGMEIRLSPVSVMFVTISTPTRQMIQLFDRQALISPLHEPWTQRSHLPEFDAQFTLVQSDFEKLQALLISNVGEEGTQHVTHN